MSARKDTSPSVATFADHEVITPANPLYKAIAQAPAEDDDPVARAEAALALLSTEFAEWMQSECERLETARQEVVRQGLTEKTHAELPNCHELLLPKPLRDQTVTSWGPRMGQR